MTSRKGTLYRIAGPVVQAKGIDATMFDLVKVGKEGLMGEVIQIESAITTIQVYEDTTMLKPGEDVVTTGKPLSAQLGPGLLMSIYDGIQRPLPVLVEKMGNYIERGVYADGLDHKKKWEFKATVKPGDKVSGGQVIGEVQETSRILHRIMVPPKVKETTIKSIKSGSYTVDQEIGKLGDGTSLKLMQEWPVRIPRPVTKKMQPYKPLITGQRVFDALFPLAKGGAAAIPGPFGAGKTVTQQTLAKWCDADIIIYIGCGERGNEMTEVLKEFPQLIDPKSGKPLMERTVLIANTSNMPVAAREASVYTGITIAEYFRDMGYSVALMADSTSRWAEAMREISSRLEEMPGEEGYPAYLSTKLADFYERAGIVNPLAKSIDEGSVTIIGAVSPPGGDFSEPVTQNTLRVTKTFWALDSKLSQRRHFPSINWLNSYSLYTDILEDWYKKNVAEDWRPTIEEIMRILQDEDRLMEVVQLVGKDALAPKEQVILETARLLRESLLQQNAFHEVDTYCELPKTYALMKIILKFNILGQQALADGKRASDIIETKAKDDISLAKFEKDHVSLLKRVEKKMEQEFNSLR